MYPQGAFRVKELGWIEKWKDEGKCSGSALMWKPGVRVFP